LEEKAQKSFWVGAWVVQLAARHVLDLFLTFCRSGDMLPGGLLSGAI
jgi:hypothetical protein